MKKHTAKIITLMLIIVCAVCLVFGISGCKNRNKPTSSKYDAIYEAYTDVLDEGAMSKTEWYSVYENAINAANLGDNFQVNGAILDGDDYVVFTFGNGKFYRLTINGSDFLECVQFTLTTKDASDALLKGVNLDIYYTSGAGRVVWRTVKTDATTGSFLLYIPVGDTNTYGIQVSAAGDHNHTYGVTEDVTFTASAADKQITVVLAEVTTYMVRVENSIGTPIAGVAIGIYHNDADNKTAIAEAVTGANGTLTAYFVVKQNAKYVIKFQNVANAIPAGYKASAEAYELDFSTKVTVIVLEMNRKVQDVDAAYSSDIAQEPDNTDLRYDYAELALDAKVSQSGNSYYVGTTKIYIALDRLIPRMNGTKTIVEIANENDKYFVVEKLHIEPGQSEEEALVANIYDNVNYTNLIKAYGAKVNSDGVYALNDDLYSFLTDCAHLLSGATGEKTDENLPLVYLDGPVLSAGEAGIYEDAVIPGYTADPLTVRLRTHTAGFFKFTISGGDPIGRYYIVVNGSDIPMTADGENLSSIVYLPAEITTVQFHSDLSYETTATISLTQTASGSVTAPDILDEDGEYTFPVYPADVVKGVYYNSNYFTTLRERQHYHYTMEILECPEDIELMGRFYIVDDSGSTGRVGYENRPISVDEPMVNYVYLAYKVGDSDMIDTKLPRLLFFHEGYDFRTVKVKFTFKNDSVSYFFERGEGDQGKYSSYFNLIDTYVSLSIPAKGFLPDGAQEFLKTETIPGTDGQEPTVINYILVGWLDEEDGAFYPYGTTILVPDINRDVTLVAQWKKPVEYTVDGQLGVGDENKLENITFKTDEVYNVKVMLNTASVTTGMYYLNAVLDKNFGTTLKIVLCEDGSTTTIPATAYMLLDEAHSSEGQYVYIGLFDKTASYDCFTIDINSSIGEVTIKQLHLKAFSVSDYTLTLDAEDEILVPFDNSSATWTSSSLNAYYVNLSGVTSGVKLRVFITNPTDIKINGFVYRYYTTSNSYGVSFGVNPGETIVVSLSSVSQSKLLFKSDNDRNYYAWLKVRIATGYKLSYDNNTDDTQYAGSLPETITSAAKGELVQITKPLSPLTRPDYDFVGWSMVKGDVYDPNTKYYQTGDYIEMPAGNVVLYAVWKLKNFNYVEVGVGEEGKLVDAIIDSSLYQGTRVKLKEGVDGATYRITLEFDHNMGGSVLFTTDSYIDVLATLKEVISGKYVYVGIAYIAEGYFIHFNMETEEPIKLSVTLERYIQATLEADSDYIEIVVNSVDAPDNYLEKITLGDTVTPGNYWFFIQSPEGKHDIYLCIGSSSIQIDDRNLAWTKGIIITIPDGVTQIYVRGYTTVNDPVAPYRMGFSIKVIKLYSVSYEKGDDEATGTAPATRESLGFNDTITVKNNTFVKDGYVFAGWKVLGDEEDTKIYQYGDTYTLNGKNVVFVAQWKLAPEFEHVEGNLGIGEQYKVTTTITADSKTATFPLENISDGKYTLQITSTADLGDLITLDLDGVALYMLKDPASTATQFIYTGFPRLTAKSKAIKFTSDIAATITAELNIYDNIVVKMDGGPVVVPFNAYGVNSKLDNTFMISPRQNDGSAFTTGATTFITVTNYSGQTLTFYLQKNGTSSSTAVNRWTFNNVAHGAYGYQYLSNSPTSLNVWYLYASTSSAAEIPMVLSLYSSNVSVTLTHAHGVDEEHQKEVSGNMNDIVAVPGSVTSFRACSYTREGYVFIGWKLEGDDTVYAVGDKFIVPAKAATITAQWVAISELEKLIGVGTTTAQLTDVTTGLRLNLDTDPGENQVTNGNYIIRIELAVNVGNMFTMEVQNFDKTKIGEVVMVHMAELDSAGCYVYMGYLNVADNTATLVYDVVNAKLGASELEVTLEKYVAPTVKADGQVYFVPAAYTSLTDVHFYVNFDQSLLNTNCRINYFDVSNGSYPSNFKIIVYADGTSMGDWINVYATIAEFGSFESLEIRQNTYNGVVLVGIKFVKVYKVAYEKNAGESEEQITGSVTDSSAYAPGEQFTVSTSVFTWEGHEFLGWEYKGKTYYANDKITVDGENVVLKALWREITVNEVENTLQVGQISNGVVLDSAKYTATRLTVDGFSSGGYNKGNYIIKVIFSEKPELDYILMRTARGANLYLVYSEADSSEGKYVFIVGFKPLNGNDNYIEFVTADADFGTYTVSVSIEENTLKYKADGVERLMSLQHTVNNSANYFSYEADSTIIAGKYQITVRDVTGKLSGSVIVEGGDSGAIDLGKVAIGSTVTVNLTSDVDLLAFYMSGNIGGMIAVTITRVVD